MAKTTPKENAGAKSLPKTDLLRDYQIAFTSRQASLIGRREVLSGKAKFGIFGDGKEVAQIAMARAFRKGDWRSGYYRDQTFMFAIGASDVRKFFAQLYADSSIENEPCSGGRQMNSHYATRFLDDKGQWLNQCLMNNSAADLSPTGGQMARLLGLAYASKLYRQNSQLEKFAQFSVKGNEVAFGTIGDASTSEGIFWEVLNAAGVLQVPMLVSVWDDGYGISVPKKYQTTKESISALIAGFKKGKEDQTGFDIYTVEGWNYPALIETYTTAVETIRKTHTPALIHVQQLTQPQGHSTSGSHERYKNDQRMNFEKEYDCITKMREWMISEGHASAQELDKIEQDATQEVNQQRQAAWDDMMNPIINERDDLLRLLEPLKEEVPSPEEIQKLINELRRAPTLQRRLVHQNAERALLIYGHNKSEAKSNVVEFCKSYDAANRKRYNTFLYADGDRSPLRIKAVPAVVTPSSARKDGREVIQQFFEYQLKKNPKMFIIGEDVGKLGGVNLEFEGLQEKFGEIRITDTGIREATILGQGIGAAMRGLRPICDIQYLDYVLYCLQVMSDDLATLHYRSAGGQIAPVIVRTKGHRLEGIWHTGSPIGTLVNSIRGMHLCVPRNMVQAAGMYATLLEGDDPALVIEVLNGYRLKEVVPDNLTEFKVALGQPEVLKEGSDVTIVTYGACIRVAQEAIKLLELSNISVELIDVQTLLPFDRDGRIVESLKKTNAVLFLDEDVVGGASAYMMQQVLDLQNGHDWLDSTPRCLSAQDHRGAYASDGDYYTKPNAEQVFKQVYAIVRERDPANYPALY